MDLKTPYTVVVADDEDELREAVCTMIPWQELGFRLVGSAGNGLDALQLVEQLEPDLLLTDIRMPFISGLELARQVRELRPMTHIAFLSGYDDFSYAQQAIRYGVISYLLKPLTVRGLSEELENIRRRMDQDWAAGRRAEQEDGEEAAPSGPAAMPGDAETAVKGGELLCRRALEAIEQNYRDPNFSLSSLGSSLEVSPNHLSACIKKYAGETFINILIRRRMQAAQELLTGSSLKIREVAERCGYTDQHYFSYCFKKYCGESPNALRRRLEKDGGEL